MAKQHFFIKLIPPRPSFASDMTADERAIMVQHVAYFGEGFKAGLIMIYGPVMDPASSFGMGVFEAESQAEVRRFLDKDPSFLAGLNKFEVSPMRVGNARGLM